MIEIGVGARWPWLGEVSVRQGIKVSEGAEIVRKKKRNGGGVRNG
jgi:hypothetical protein